MGSCACTTKRRSDVSPAQPPSHICLTFLLSPFPSTMPSSGLPNAQISSSQGDSGANAEALGDP